MDTECQIYSEVSEFLSNGMESLAKVVEYREENKNCSLKLISINRRDAHLVLHSTLLKMRHDYSGRMIADPTEVDPGNWTGS